jgi:hypothetical protein
VSKASVTRLFVGAGLVVVGGFIVAIVALVVALLNGVVTIGGEDVVRIDGDAFGDMLVWILISGFLIGAGTIGAIAAWIGALFNTVQLDDKTWFVILLVLGLASFGWLAMIAYVLSGPDGRADTRAAGPVLPRR